MWMMPRRSASANAAVRSCTLNFKKMLLMCALAVSPLIPSAAAISLFLFPVASSSSTWNSRNVSDGCLARGRAWPPQSRRNRPLTRVDVPDDADQVIGQRVLQEIAHRAGRDRPKDVLIAVVHRQHDDPGIRLLAADRLNRLDTVHGRHLEVHQRDVGPIPQELLDRLFTIARLGHDGHVRLHADDAGDAFAHQPVVIDTENANRVGHLIYSAAPSTHRDSAASVGRADARAAEWGLAASRAARSRIVRSPRVLAASGGSPVGNESRIRCRRW